MLEWLSFSTGQDDERIEKCRLTNFCDKETVNLRSFW
jgi:hypothetical protein